MPADGLCRLLLEGQADPSCLDRVHDLVDELWVRVPDVRTTDRYAFETAVIEVAGNILVHGHGDALLRLELRVHEDRLEADFRDTGPAVVLPDADAAPDDPLAEHGRGMALARATVDDVAYERTGRTNRWHLLKQRSLTT